jgi:hypothetical protein
MRRSSIDSSDNAKVSTLQASLGDRGAAGPSQPLQDAIVPATGIRRFGLRPKKLKHFQSLDHLPGPGTQSSAIQGRPGRQRSASLSPNKSDGLVCVGVILEVIERYLLCTNVLLLPGIDLSLGLFLLPRRNPRKTPYISPISGLSD